MNDIYFEKNREWICKSLDSMIDLLKNALTYPEISDDMHERVLNYQRIKKFLSYLNYYSSVSLVRGKDFICCYSRVSNFSVSDECIEQAFKELHVPEELMPDYLLFEITVNNGAILDCRTKEKTVGIKYIYGNASQKIYYSNVSDATPKNISLLGVRYHGPLLRRNIPGIVRH